MNCRRVLRAIGIGSWDGGRAATRVSALGLTMCVSLAGCGPSQDQVRLHRAMYFLRGEVYPEYRDALEILEKVCQDPKKRGEFVQYGMCETTAAVLGGHYDRADQVAKHVHLAVRRYQDVDKEKLAAWGNEAIKFFKGEPHERAMLAYYAGLVCYINGEYNDARIFFTQSLLATATRDDDMDAFRDDFRLGHFWLGRAFLMMGQEGNARVGFQKAQRRLQHKTEERETKKIKSARKKAYKKELKAEELCYKRASEGKDAVAGIADLSQPTSRSLLPPMLPGAAEGDPTVLSADTLDEFLDPEFQRAVNLIIVVELGRGPLKYLRGSSGSLDEYARMDYLESSVDVYVDGHFSGPAFRLVDMYHQAVTRGVKTRRGRQTGKVIAKEILKQLPIVGMVAGQWDIKGDNRHWTSLPGEIHVYTARVEPGLHHIRLKFCDINGRYLPRFDIWRHYIRTYEEQDTVLVVHSVENQDNAFVLAHGESK